MAEIVTRAPVSRPWLGLGAVIASITTVGLMQGAVAPLLSLNLERQGVGSSWNGLLAAMPSLATLVFGALTPTIIRRLGAATTIYAGAGIGLMALLLFPVLDRLPAWFALRFMMGVGMIGVWVVSEAWITALAPEKNRGTVMGAYVSVLCVGFAAGPAVLGLMGSAGAVPFVASAAMLAVALLPIPLASGSGGAPSFHQRAALPLAQAVRHAPAIMIAALLNGGIWAIQSALLPVYGVRVGLPENRALLLLTVFVLGNIVLQLPIGKLLDSWSQKGVLLLCGSIQCFGAVAFPFIVHDSPITWLFLLVWGGFLGGLYTTEMTMLGRRFEVDELSGASAAFSMAFSLGALFGPIVAGVAMQIWDPHGMLLVIGYAGAGVILTAVRLVHQPSAQRSYTDNPEVPEPPSNEEHAVCRRQIVGRNSSQPRDRP
jgi:MFS family permease